MSPLLDGTAFLEALLHSRLPRTPAVSFLQCISVVVATLERSLSGGAGRPPRKHDPGLEPELPRLLSDLSLVESEREPSVWPALKEAIQLADQIVMIPRTHLDLLGWQRALCLLQVEASAVCEPLAAALGVDKGRLAYLAPRANDASSPYARIADAIERLAPGPSGASEVERGFRAAREGLAAMIAALYPFDEAEVRFHVAAVNPEAGDHPMPSDPVEIAIAVRAAVGVRERFPYVDARFADRGRRFTSSDSCWLVTLTKHDYLAVSRSIAWLRRVLAVRGLPTILIEAHMEVIVAEFEQSLPAKTESMTGFRQVVADLAAEREALVPVSLPAAPWMDFEDRLAAIDSQFSPVIPILASALADERSGIRGAFAAVCAWLETAVPANSAWTALVRQVSRELQAIPPASAS